MLCRLMMVEAAATTGSPGRRGFVVVVAPCCCSSARITALKKPQPVRDVGVVENDGGMLSQESDQVSKWEELDSSDHTEVCKNLLSAMELVDDDEEITVFGEDQSELSKEMVDHITADRVTKMTDLQMEPCVKRKKKREQWGPILIERQRRKRVPMLQKAVQLKQKKNLDLFKGNSFAALHVDYLNQCPAAVDIRE
jgi:hypothetical protein